ncbi:selenide, water dikinase SelD [Lichenibacterium minor]|jgi:selenide,water dikinase|uniref:Selenide, water dikinase n=1 Tax=Lichenibacterium minor TaxID=2316528 RepID=A0A4Q2U3N8_9HYPH|nr:selenide, water dikinase SelD [Lichenibacterium minor]RYC30820.1 selenide, water dikinase SelD [Lichenibacterium minor]
MDAPFRLTSLAHGGGCGCKLAPSVLRDILAKMPEARPYAAMMVGIETGDDAAVYRLNDAQALIATTDFFTPIVDDPRDFGRIAATNALSDVYAMGGTPIFALAVVGMPIDKLPVETIQEILGGGASVCADIGIPVAGGHSIDTPEPVYGLVALGLVHPDRVLRNVGAKPGDRLVLTKGLGVGIQGAALKRGALSDEGYAAMVASTTQVNVLGADMPALPGVRAMTDVTGFGLLGHALEMVRGSGLGLSIDFAALPLLDGVADLAAAGIRTGASTRNWASFGAEVKLGPALPAWGRDLLCDPQTSGGLLVAVSPDGLEAVLAKARERGFGRASVIGTFNAGDATVTVA